MVKFIKLIFCSHFDTNAHTTTTTIALCFVLHRSVEISFDY